MKFFCVKIRKISSLNAVLQGYFCIFELLFCSMFIPTNYFFSRPASEVFSGQDFDYLNKHGSDSSTVSHLGNFGRLTCTKHTQKRITNRK